MIVNNQTPVTTSNPVIYSVSSGSLPLGLDLLSNGLIVGLPSVQPLYFNNNSSVISNVTITATVGSTRAYNYTEPDLSGANVVSQDFQKLVESSKSFELTVNPSSNFHAVCLPQTNLSLEFLLADEDYQTLTTPLFNESIVPNNVIYRADDFYFGIQTNVRLLIAYGLPPVTAENIMAALARFHQNKTFLFTNLKWAQSTSEGYEVIYIQPIDEYTDLNGNTYTGSIPLGVITSPTITADSDIYNASTFDLLTNSNRQSQLFPATIPNMIEQLQRTLGNFDINFLPSWMTDLQPNGQQIGFIPAIPVLYIKPGQGQRVMYYLQQYYDSVGPALNTIKGQTDRYIWNYGYIQNWNPTSNSWVTSGNVVVADTFLTEDQASIYLKFPNEQLIPQPIVVA